MRPASIIIGLALLLVPGVPSAEEKPYRVSLIGDAFDGRAWTAGLLIELDPGWKTYWRMPGDAGLAPSFDWSKSANLAAATVLYPAPKVFTDKSGTTVGYEGRVFLPVEVAPKAAGQPISLAVEMNYGICQNICVPLTAEMKLEVPAGEAALAPAAALIALDRVPKPASASPQAGAPALVRAEAALSGAQPKITVEARFPGEPAGAAVFLEAANGQFLPVPKETGTAAQGTRVFEAALGRAADAAALKGTEITVTLVGETGATYTTFVAK